MKSWKDLAPPAGPADAVEALHFDLGHELNFFKNGTYFHTADQLTRENKRPSVLMCFGGKPLRLCLGAPKRLDQLADDLIEGVYLIIEEDNLGRFLRDNVDLRLADLLWLLRHGGFAAFRGKVTKNGDVLQCVLAKRSSSPYIYNLQRTTK